MAVADLQWAAAIYLIACLVAGTGLVLRSRRLARAAVWLLAAGALLHGLSFPLLHAAGRGAAAHLAGRRDLVHGLDRDALLPGAAAAACGSRAWSCWSRRPPSWASSWPRCGCPRRAPPPSSGSGSWPHAHVLLASVGLALLGLAGLSSLVFLSEHRRLKTKASVRRPLRAALARGARPRERGRARGGLHAALAGRRHRHALGAAPRAAACSAEPPHETWSLVAWAVYAVLAALRFGGRQGARQAATAAVFAFGFLFFAVIGVELFA